MAIQAVSRALHLMELISRSSQPRGLMELASEAELDKTTAMRLLVTLLERGWVIRDQDTKRYSVGPVLVGMGASAGLPDRLPVIAYPLILGLRDATGETVSLQRRFNDVRVCVAGLESEEPVRRGLPLGMPLPLFAGPSGKTILAFLGQDPFDAGALGLSSVEVARMQSDLERIRKEGFLSTDGDRTPGVAAVSAPIFDPHGVYGSLTVAGPSARFKRTRRAESVPALLEAAERLTGGLAGDPSVYKQWRLKKEEHEVTR